VRVRRRPAPRPVDDTLHVYPTDSVRVHVLTRDCWCGPRRDDADPIWIHGHGPN
jgi:hypothetical protein